MELVGYLLCLIGGIIILGTRFHHFLINAYLTEAQALIFYWPMWVISIILIVCGYLVIRKWNFEANN